MAMIFWFFFYISICVLGAIAVVRHFQTMPRADSYIWRMVTVSWEIVVAMFTAMVAVIGSVVKFSNDVARMKSRLIALEVDNEGHKRVQRELLDSIHKIEITLAQLLAKLEK